MFTRRRGRASSALKPQSASLSHLRNFEPVAQRSGAPVERPKAMKVPEGRVRGAPRAECLMISVA